MYQSFRTKIQSVDISDSAAWSTGAHMSSRNRYIMQGVSTCKQDATVELLVMLIHTFFFEIRGRPRRNHHLRPRGGTAVTACCVENIR